MTTTKCDKCGKEMCTFPWQQMHFPTYIISVFASAGQEPQKVDLCAACSKAFADWLHNENSKKEENNHE